MTSRKCLLGSMCTAALAACAPSSGEAPQVSGAGTFNVLTPLEQARYVTDQLYIHDLVKPNTRVRLNLADPQQHRFAMTRLKLAGKTPVSSPYLYERMEARRADHIARKLPPGTFVAPSKTQSLVGDDAELKEMHYVELASLDKLTATTAEINGTAASTFIGGSYYVYLDTFITTTAGYPVSDFAYNEVFEPPPDANLGANVTTSASGDPLATSLQRFSVTTYKVEDSAEGFQDDYLYVDIGSANAQTFAGIPDLSAPIVTAPVETITNGNISVCIDRAWTNDCDYIVPGIGAQSIRMPLAGSVTVTSAHVFDRNQIQDIKDALANDEDPGVDYGSLKLVLTNAGGGCDVTDGNTLYARMRMFWDTVAVSPDNRTFSWNLSGATAAYFDQGCRQIQNRAKLTARIALPMLSVPEMMPYNTSITITSDPEVVRPEALLTPITLTNSCLAAGTQIRLGDGTLASIEALKIGQQVFNPYDRSDRALTISDTAKGAERAPMVRIRDEAGRTLMMTEMHPIATPDRGMVQARALRTGDLVMTERGPSKLAEVTREPYAGQVYNLKLGSERELASLGQDETVVHANGFVVGDGQIQTKYEALAAQRDRRSVDEIPAQWRLDALLSPKRH
jgi:hypothetical protein